MKHPKRYEAYQEGIVVGKGIGYMEAALDRMGGLEDLRNENLVLTTKNRRLQTKLDGTKNSLEIAEESLERYRLSYTKPDKVDGEDKRGVFIEQNMYNGMVVGALIVSFVFGMCELIFK